MKKLVAYSSVSHLGFVMLGLLSLNRQGLEGGIYQMLNHGLSTGALFILVGVLYERRHTRAIADFGGLARSMPLYATVLVVVALSSIGLPGLNGFVGEFLTLIGAYRATPLHAVLACGGVVLGAVYMLWMVERVVFGKPRVERNRNGRDLDAREVLTFAPLLVLFVVMGVYPGPFLGRMHTSVGDLVRHVESRLEPGHRAGISSPGSEVREEPQGPGAAPVRPAPVRPVPAARTEADRAEERAGAADRARVADGAEAGGRADPADQADGTDPAETVVLEGPEGTAQGSPAPSPRRGAGSTRREASP
jgi:hypothetical protein